MEEDTFDERFRMGVGLINRKEFFEAHDVLEDLWNETHGELRLFLQGMIQAAVGCYHLSNGNTTGAISQYQKSLDKLTKYPDDYMGIDLSSFREGLERCYAGACLMAEKDARYEVDPVYFPEVRFISS
ncbi:MAG TPA: DUF309 domain-containing protein [Candidatus Kapabacteria bacterium]|nr:DUF309 domain-containing protein [Candidatus Kapabacteria bacterium]